MGDRYQEARALNDLGMGSVVRGRFDEGLRAIRTRAVVRGSRVAVGLRRGAEQRRACVTRSSESSNAPSMSSAAAVSLHTGRGTRADFAQALAGLGNTLISRKANRARLCHWFVRR